jgi:hypothetical protein
MNPNDDPNNQVPNDPNAPQDDLFPGFLNPSDNPADQQVPGFLQDGQDGSQPSQPQQYIRAGSPEAPITIPVETQPAGPEQGMESSESQEYGRENPEQVENKELKKVQNDNNEQVKRPLPKPVTVEAPQKGPQLYGYMVPPQIIKNFNLIRSRKLKGSPTASKTWLYVLLDRILKMHNKQG